MVTSPKQLAEGDYKSLILYCSVIERNYNRLTSMELRHEISNSTTMAVILRKFPRSVMNNGLNFLLLSLTETKPKLYRCL